MNNTIKVKLMDGTELVKIDEMTYQEIELIRDLECLSIKGKQYKIDEMEFCLDANEHYLVIFMY